MSEIKNKFVSWTLNVVKEIREVEQPKLYGVGIGLSTVTSSSSSRVIVSGVDPNGSAAKAGLCVNDVVVQVDGTRLDDDEKCYSPQDVAKLVRGPKGSVVDMTVERGGERIRFTLSREPIGNSLTPMLRNGATKSNSGVVAGGLTKELACRAETAQEEDLVLSENIEEHHEMDKSNTAKEMFHSNEGQKKEEQHNQPVRPYLFEETKSIQKPQDLSSSNEDNDQFHDQPILLLPTRKSFEDRQHSSEEKTLDNETSSIINGSSIDGEHWELLSERSGSAVVISFSGSVSGASFRSGSPSVLSNKFILSESTGEEYMEHVVLPTDTLQGLCLAYKISATRLRMVNGFSGNFLQMAPKKLRIPTNVKTAGMMIRTQDKSSKEYKLYALMAELPSMELVEAKAYLDLSNWDLEEALRSAREDDGWNLKGDGGFDNGVDYSPIVAVAKPKALTAQDIYAAPPPFEGDGFELKDISSCNT
eukprot:CCRYP_003091-RA/>CCRYP_003091-RA protein AED:0.01 eAED:0.01 QI:159/1/1/1/0.33/0.25/4/1831/474